MLGRTILLKQPPSYCGRMIRSQVYIITNRNLSSSFWQWTTQSRPYWTKDKKEGMVAAIVFGVAGSTSAWLVRPTVEKVFGIEGSLIDGPNSYRLVSLLCLSPVYAIILGTFGTLAGRHNFFAGMAFKIIGRFLPKGSLTRVMCTPAKLKLKE